MTPEQQAKIEQMLQDKPFRLFKAGRQVHFEYRDGEAYCGARTVGPPRSPSRIWFRLYLCLMRAQILLVKLGINTKRADVCAECERLFLKRWEYLI